MSAITLNTAHQAERFGQKLETILAVLREMLDAFVSNRMRKAAAEAEHAHSLRQRGVHTSSIGWQ